MDHGILMVEDDDGVVCAARVVIGREGWRFAHTASAAEAPAVARAFRPDVILLDVDLPDGDGFSVCRALKLDPELEQVPVIFLTASTDVKSRLRGFAAGAQDYVPKPFSLEELVARLRIHLGHKLERDALAGENRNLVLRERAAKDLTDMVVHDLRAPATCIMATIQLLGEDGALGLEGGRMLSNARESAEFLLFMINDLLDLRTGSFAVKPDVTDLQALARRLAAFFSEKAALRGATLKTAAPPPPAEFFTDPMLLFRVGVNLLSNAIRHTPEGGEVELRFSLAGGRLLLEVLDRGPGVPDAFKESIFLRYASDNPKDGKHEFGSGIGLAFCRGACEALGGVARVEDREGGGSRFIADLPPAGNPAGAITPEMMRIFLLRVEADAARLRRAADGGPDDLARLARLAHGLKGSAGTYGLHRLSALAGELEAALKGAAGGAGGFPGRARAALALMEMELEQAKRILIPWHSRQGRNNAE